MAVRPVHTGWAWIHSNLLNSAHPAGSMCLWISSSILELRQGSSLTDGCLETRPLTSGHQTPELFSVDEICYQVPAFPIFFTIWTKSLAVCTLVLSASNPVAFHNCVPGQSLTPVLWLESHFKICNNLSSPGQLGFK